MEEIHTEHKKTWSGAEIHITLPSDYKDIQWKQPENLYRVPRILSELQNEYVILFLRTTVSFNDGYLFWWVLTVEDTKFHFTEKAKHEIGPSFKMTAKNILALLKISYTFLVSFLRETDSVFWLINVFFLLCNFLLTMFQNSFFLLGRGGGLLAECRVKRYSHLNFYSIWTVL